MGATISAGLHKQIASPDLLVETSECVAQLKSLRVETLFSSFSIDEVQDTYQAIIAEFSRVEV
ncbi:MAG: hypothetical protein AAFY78_13960 [Cyanobacteria bacterium J06648_16]